MAYPTDVKIFWCDPGMTSIGPFAGGTAGRGTLIAALDACLVDGYGLKTADTVVVSGGVATVTISTGHEYGKWQVALIAGATPAGLNGQKRILSATTNTFTFDATGIPDGTATGTITTKIAPLGWTRPFTGTNKRAYRIDTVANPTASTMYLRVDESTFNYAAQMLVYETMSDIDTGTGRVPTAAQGHFTSKSESLVSTSYRYWCIIGDSRGFYIINHSYSATYTTPEYGGFVSFFGDPVSLDEADPYKFMIGTDNSSDLTSTPSSTNTLFTQSPSYMKRTRSANRVTQSLAVQLRGMLHSSQSGGPVGASGLEFPNRAGGGIQLSKMQIKETSPTYTLHGHLPGAYFVENTICDLLHRQRLTRIFDSGSPAFPNRVIAYLLTTYSSNVPGVSAFDIIGPWR